MHKDQNQESTKQVVVTVKIVITTIKNGFCAVHVAIFVQEIEHVPIETKVS